MTDRSDLDFITACLVEALTEERHTVVPKLFKMYEEIKENQEQPLGNLDLSSIMGEWNSTDDVLSFDYDDRLSIEYNPLPDEDDEPQFVVK
jgi:hypothetical protein